MKIFPPPITIFLFFSFITLSLTGISQSTASIVASSENTEDLFQNNEILNIKLSGNIRSVLNDRAENGKYRPLVISYKSKDSTDISIPITVRTRGHFRLDKSNCVYPPLLLNFSKKEKGTPSIFDGQNKLKLVTPCRQEEYVIREYLIYKLYNLVTDSSYRARLVKVEFEDTEKKKITGPLYGILIEEDQQMAQRNQCVLIKRKEIKQRVTNQNLFLKMAFFQYMIGNTDWSVPALHNIRLMTMPSDTMSVPSTVPYDFDYAGIVNTTYAVPSELLPITSVRERIWRGICGLTPKELEDVIALFNNLKKDFYNVYTSCTLLDSRYVKSTIKYLDDFYDILNNPKELMSELEKPCR